MRSKAMGLLVVCVLSVPVFAATPAVAKACDGQGIMHLSQKVGLPIIGAKSNVGFSLGIKCTVGGGTAFGSGNIKSASCGRMTGGVGTINAKKFKFQVIGTVAIMSGKVTGVFNMIPDVRKGDSCQSGTADDFLITFVGNGL